VRAMGRATAGAASSAPTGCCYGKTRPGVESGSKLPHSTESRRGSVWSAAASRRFRGRIWREQTKARRKIRRKENLSKAFLMSRLKPRPTRLLRARHYEKRRSGARSVRAVFCRRGRRISGHSMLCPYGFIGAMDMKDRAEGTSGRRAVNSKAKRAGRDARGLRSERENQKSRRDAGATKGDGAGLRQFSIEGRGGSLWRSTLLGRGGG
jgi:hypothetical protein